VAVPAAAALVALAALTHLPWLASWLMPDVFVGLILVSLLMLAKYWRVLPWWERARCFWRSSRVPAPCTSRIPPLLLGLGLFALIVFLLPPAWRARRVVGRTAVLALTVAAVGWGALVASNLITYRQATTSLGQSTFLFGRLNADGDSRAVLRPHCEAGARWVVAAISTAWSGYRKTSSSGRTNRSPRCRRWATSSAFTRKRGSSTHFCCAPTGRTGSPPVPSAPCGR
jgi:hypothetical protein